MRCDHCAHDVPDGVFCTRCGAHQGTTEEFGNAKLREHRYAAHPGEHVAQPSCITTLSPHLGHRKLHELRWPFLAFPALVTCLVLVTARGAGFSTQATLIDFATTLQYPAPVARANWFYSLISISLLSPLQPGSATGMIVAAVWRQRLDKLGGREIGA